MGLRELNNIDQVHGQYKTRALQIVTGKFLTIGLWLQKQANTKLPRRPADKGLTHTIIIILPV